MTEPPEDATLAWTREMVADLTRPGNEDDGLGALGTTDAEADVLAAMTEMPEQWQRHVADIAQGIAKELAEAPEAAPSAGRHARPEQEQ